MNRSRTRRSTDLTHEVVEFMTEFARLLVSAGISRNRFARIVEFAYFQAASRKARFGNDKLNQSAVAAMTGLTRTQVRAISRRPKATPELANDHLDRVVEHWTSDAEYLTASFAPRRLRLAGRSPSFSSLVRKAGGDIPPRSILRELERQGFALRDGGYVKLNRAGCREAEIRTLRQLSRALARVIQSPSDSDQAGSPIRTVTMELRYPSLSGTGRILMQRRLAKILKALGNDIESAGAAVAMETPSTSRRRSGRVSQARVLFITQEKEV